MTEYEFWNKCWKYATVVLCLIVVCVAGSSQYTKYAIAKMVEQGATPIEAACAIDAASDGSIARAECVVFLLSGHKTEAD